MTRKASRSRIRLSLPMLIGPSLLVPVSQAYAYEAVVRALQAIGRDGRHSRLRCIHRAHGVQPLSRPCTAQRAKFSGSWAPGKLLPLDSKSRWPTNRAGFSRPGRQQVTAIVCRLENRSVSRPFSVQGKRLVIGGLRFTVCSLI